ncbi:hypothetical protein Q73A0000_02035 [Kaistella flava (ex Peng et al. 2021)]|uniref:Uncharacterized protein n=1 Tax=Kaistella flava (ex Peng et al. 2021) TaxID=2038776 RepID=A0A7M2Y525_9FLAO|nr:hypothetical protein [Kaistella flava (ex Peng et al. 2021)]QOW09220.1 hypothetical protein Q73A0000_02035 [Kaistella flava (ex Peng et al. 2021)]
MMTINLQSVLKYTMLLWAFYAISSCGKSKTNSIESTTDSTKIATMEVSKNSQKSDSVALIKAFSKLETNLSFLKELGLNGEKHFTWNDDLMKIISGDLNGDGVQDALLFFSVEGRDGGNNWSTYYAAFLNINKEWKYQSLVNAGGDFSDRILKLTKIENGNILGNWVGNKEGSLKEIPVNFILKNGVIINIFTGLHQEEDAGNREYLFCDEIFTADHIVVPISSTLNNYEKLLGKAKVVKYDEMKECGTVYDELHYRELVYKDLIFELSSKNKASLISINMLGSGIKFQSGNGTIDENTKISDLRKLFPDTFSSTGDFDENNEETFTIATGAESDDSWMLHFNRSGKLTKITYLVQC